MFFAVWSEQDYSRMLRGGKPWPKGSYDKANFGEGVYLFGDREMAVKYLKRKMERKNSKFDETLGIQVQSVGVNYIKLRALNVFYIRKQSSTVVDDFMNKHSFYGGHAKPHGYDLIITPRGEVFTEYYFSKDVYHLLEVK